MIYIGIDPGKQGAIAMLGPEPTRTIPVPLLTGAGRPAYNLAAIRDTLAAAVEAGPVGLVVVERLDALPPKFRTKGGQEIAGGGAFANYARGEAQGWAWMLTALGLPFQLVRPQTWQSAMLKGQPKALGAKERSIAAAQQLFPGVSLLPGPRCRKPSDGFADALLLAEYARRLHTGGELFAAAERSSEEAAVPTDAFAE